MVILYDSVTSDIRAILGCVSILCDICTMTKLWFYFSDHIPVIRGHARVVPAFPLKYSRFVNQTGLKLLGSSDIPVLGSQELGLQCMPLQGLKHQGCVALENRWFSLLNRENIH